ncbi:hypothetical protein DFH07DRAFT_978192 [Mycena maculata]|uniref:Cytochrome P450 n=1 Tax=Mycena maculata TaxID=230809 RepID=A0AAD7ILY2_9AGAR|nr:hypothetical protein DFH07DRAFT_978192 [Mycena maculata]
MVFYQLIVSVAGTLGAYALYGLSKLAWKEFNSPLRNLQGPKSSHFFFGNFKEIWEAANYDKHEQWVKRYGPTLKYHGFFGMTQLYTIDSKAMNHVLTNSHIYPKPDSARYNAGRIGLTTISNSLASEDETELGKAFNAIFHAVTRVNPLRILQTLFLVLRLIPTMMRIGRRLLQDSKNEMAEDGTFEKGRARDLLSLLVRANTSKDIPPDQRLSDEAVLARKLSFASVTTQ